jgi:hypothetical protein
MPSEMRKSLSFHPLALLPVRRTKSLKNTDCFMPPIGGRLFQGVLRNVVVPRPVGKPYR